MQEILLKSDQGGIESPLGRNIELLTFLELKSDQGGIESEKIKRISEFFDPVEIRPRWDWKIAQRYVPADECNVEIRPRWDWKIKETFNSLEQMWVLKSDQGGIERRLRLHTPFRYARLKSDQGGIERGDILKEVFEELQVEIRPRWDWK